MESRRAGRRPRAGSVAAQGQAPSVAAFRTPATFPQIEAIIRSGGQIMIGTVAPITGAAVAHDGKSTLAMLRCRPQEPLPDLLQRLEAAISTAKATGNRVDEINRPNAAQRYEL